MKTIECWKLETISGAEGEHISLTARFINQDEAEKAEPACGGYGGKVSKETIIIFDTAVEWNPSLDADAKASGLAKLSSAERKALGLER